MIELETYFTKTDFGLPYFVVILLIDCPSIVTERGILAVLFSIGLSHSLKILRGLTNPLPRRAVGETADRWHSSNMKNFNA